MNSPVFDNPVTKAADEAEARRMTLPLFIRKQFVSSCSNKKQTNKQKQRLLAHEMMPLETLPK